MIVRLDASEYMFQGKGSAVTDDWRPAKGGRVIMAEFSVSIFAGLAPISGQPGSSA
jgi:hypothetical protein